MRGFFITLEGGEGAGKSTQAARLTTRIGASGREVVRTREPGGSAGAEAIRALLVTGAPERWSPTTETLLMYAARRDHVERLIAPALDRGAVVISDRFADSTRAYQGAAGGVDQTFITGLEANILAGVRPDLTLILDLSAECGLARSLSRDESEGRFERKGLEFHRRLGVFFRKLAVDEPERCVLIDGARAEDEVRSVDMARGRATTDRMTEATPHPREVFDYVGGEAAEADFLGALGRGRLHHAWLLTGPEGGGKATFAYRAARRLLGARPRQGEGSLDSDPGDPISRQIISRANPDLFVLQRDPEDGKTRKGIPVDEARALPEFFAKSPARAAYRVAIIDAADDLNVNAANAVLKTLEEPPTRGVLLLVTHAPGALLATLRSRCRRLRIDPPAADVARGWVIDRAGVSGADADRLLAMARGAPGRAWRLAREGALALDDLAADAIKRLPDTDDAAMLALAESFRGAAGQDRFALFFDRLADHAHGLAVQRRSVSLAKAWVDLVDLPRQAEAVNLDRVDVLFTALSRLRAAA